MGDISLSWIDDLTLLVTSLTAVEVGAFGFYQKGYERNIEVSMDRLLPDRVRQAKFRGHWIGISGQELCLR